MDPETRLSLLMRIRDPDDRDAWHQFTQLYQPVVTRLARGRGLQEADAEDLSQQVLLSVMHAIDRFEAKPEGPRFRAWLKTIARNSILNTLTRKPIDAAVGGSDAGLVLEAQVADPEASGLDWEYRREIFRAAATLVRDEFHADTWQAFWQTAIENRDARLVAKTLERSVGSVYTARCRVMKRLREAVVALDTETVEFSHEKPAAASHARGERS